MRAVVIQTAGEVAVREVREPRLRPGHFKVKTIAIALNSNIKYCFISYYARADAVFS